MSPNERRKEVGEEWNGWNIIFKVGMVAIPLSAPVMSWLIVESIINREFRNMGTRYTKEEHQQYKQETDLRFDKMEQKQDAIYDTVSRIDERVLSIQKAVNH